MWKISSHQTVIHTFYIILALGGIRLLLSSKEIHR